MPSRQAYFLIQNELANGILLLAMLALALFLLVNFIAQKFNFSPKQLGYVRLSAYTIATGTALLRASILQQSFWYDEAFTAAISQLNFTNAITVILSDVHPPLAYALFWLTVQAMGLWAIRISSYIAGIAIVYALYRLGKTWGEDVGKVAASLGAVMPALIWYSAEARAYSFLVLAVLVVLIAYQEKRPIALSIALGLLPLLHVYGYLYAAIIGFFVLYRGIVPMKYLAAAAGPAVLWLPFMAIQSLDVANGFWLPSPDAGAAFLPFIEMQIGLSYPTWAALLIIPCLVIPSFLAGLYNLKADMQIYWLVIIAVPTTALILSYVWHPIYLSRAILPIACLLILFYARWIVEKKSAAATLLYLAIAISLGFKLMPDAARPDLRGFVAQCGDRPIYAVSIESAIVADAYTDAPISIYSDWNNLNQSLSSQAVQALGYEVKNIPNRGACLFWQYNPLTTPSQKTQHDLVVAVLSLQCTEALTEPYFIIEVCQ